VIQIIRTLQRRREALVLRSTAQRARLSARLAPAARKLAAADRLVAAVQAHPVIAGIAATGLALIGGRRLLRWALRIAPLYALLVK
jgi:hypothetical protein